MFRIEFTNLLRTNIPQIERLKTVLYFSSFILVESIDELISDKHVYVNTSVDFVELYISHCSIIPALILNIVKENGGGNIQYNI